MFGVEGGDDHRVRDPPARGQVAPVLEHDRGVEPVPRGEPVTSRRPGIGDGDDFGTLRPVRRVLGICGATRARADDGDGDRAAERVADVIAQARVGVGRDGHSLTAPQVSP